MCEVLDRIEQKGIEKGIERGIEKGILSLIEFGREQKMPEDVIKRALIKKFNLSDKKTEKYLQKRTYVLQ